MRVLFFPLLEMTTAYNKLVTMFNQAVAAGKAIDVSKIKTDGSGALTIVLPKTGRSTKRGFPDFPVYSDNYASYKFAIDIFGPEYLPYAEQYLATFGDGTQAVAVAALPGVALPGAVDPATVVITAYNDIANRGGVLDVSELKPDGTGARKKKMPKTGKGNKKWIGDLPVVSDNYATYRLAMSFFGPEFDQYADQFLAQFGETKYVRIPKPKTAVSPRKIKTTFIAPVAPTVNLGPQRAVVSPGVPRLVGGAVVARAPVASPRVTVAARAPVATPGVPHLIGGPVAPRAPVASPRVAVAAPQAVIASPRVVAGVPHLVGGPAQAKATIVQPAYIRR